MSLRFVRARKLPNCCSSLALQQQQPASLKSRGAARRCCRPLPLSSSLQTSIAGELRPSVVANLLQNQQPCSMFVLMPWSCTCCSSLHYSNSSHSQPCRGPLYYRLPQHSSSSSGRHLAFQPKSEISACICQLCPHPAASYSYSLHASPSRPFVCDDATLCCILQCSCVTYCGELPFYCLAMLPLQHFHLLPCPLHWCRYGMLGACCSCGGRIWYDVPTTA